MNHERLKYSILREIFYEIFLLQSSRFGDLLRTEKAIINVYRMDDDLNGFVVKTFDEDLIEWIDFVCKCRDGEKEYQKYDLIFGKVANDKVFRVVDMYHTKNLGQGTCS